MRNKLAPQWENRDQVKHKMGKERWENNPNPKRDFAAQREELERELRAIEQAMDQLGFLKINLDVAYERSQTIYEAASGRDAMKSKKGATGYRYNGIRPENSIVRVSLKDYPDPTDFGWIFTGSSKASLVEFFEKRGKNDAGDEFVKLDWYFSTGTVKTSMEHPT